MSAGDERRARLHERRAKLSPEQQARLAQRLAAPGTAAPELSLDAGAGGCLVGIQPTGSRPAFFCVHPAGGDVLCYAALARHLHPQQPLYAFQAPGLHDDEEPPGALEALARRYARELRLRQPRGPYLLGGWSLGGAVAFEMARDLEQAGEAVALLAIFDTVPGGARLDVGEHASSGADEDNARWLLAIATYVERLWGLALGVGEGDLAGLTGEAQMQLFLERLRHAGLLRGESTLAQVRRLVRVLRVNSRAWSAYAPRPLGTRLTLFRAEDQTDAVLDETMGWGALSSAPIDVQVVPGDHISLLAEPHVRVLARHLQARLERAQGGMS